MIDTTPIDAQDLTIYIDCDHDMYDHRWKPITTALTRRKIKGTYNHELAAKAFMPMVDEGARKYRAEFPEYTISVGVKRETADDMRDRFEVEYDIRNYNYLVE